ncbi:MAG: glycosyltransferase family 4 protein [Bacteroidales bacterium]
MNIAFLLENIASSGGTERVATLIANQLACRGHRITIISLTGDNPFFELEKTIRILCIEKKRVRYISFIKQLINTRKVIAELNPDILVNVGTNLSLFTWMNYGSRTRIISWEHFIYERNFTAPRLRAGFFLAKKISTKIILLSDKEASKWNDPKAVVINNPRSFYTHLQPDYSSKKAIAIGHLNYNKGFDQLLKAWQKVTGIHPDASLQIYGQGEEAENLSKLTKELGIESTVSILKPTRDIISAYLNSSVYLMTSRSENQPMVLLEAMSCGLPVVAFDCPTGPGEIIHSGEDGILVEPENTDNYAEAVISLLNDCERRKSYGIKGRQNVEKYNIENIILQWESIFEEIK